MPSEDIHSTDVAQQRAELQVVLGSELFTRAPTLAHLLSYLCEKSFAGESSQIKEYSIGVEVFHRGSEFDQDSDSIVRVQANRLRKRLAEYYASDAASSHTLRITIPVGQYVPHFEVIANEAAAATAAEPVASEHVLDKLPSGHPRRKALILWTIGCLLLITLLSAAVLAGKLWQSRRQEQAAAEQTQEAQKIGPPAGDEIRILAGARHGYVDHAGKLWGADAYFDGGNANNDQQARVLRTLETNLYRNSRQGNFRYAIPLKPGSYELHLHFAENFYGMENNGGGEGSRVMTVRANGQTLLEHFDVAADAGEAGAADVKVFPAISPDKDGLLHLEFLGEKGEAMLSAIEILPGDGHRLRPIRLLARLAPYYSNDSRWWSPDNYYEGGQISSYSEEAANSDDAELYASERWGHFRYTIPVTPGRYSLTLFFAGRPKYSLPGEERVFHVFCNGRALLENFALRPENGKTSAITRHFNNLEPDSQGKLILEFVPVKGYAALSGLEVAQQ
jgi:hypothetical protein